MPDADVENPAPVGWTAETPYPRAGVPAGLAARGRPLGRESRSEAKPEPSGLRQGARGSCVLQAGLRTSRSGRRAQAVLARPPVRDNVGFGSPRRTYPRSQADVLR